MNPELGKLILKAINSRVGLVVLFIAYTSSPWGLGVKLDEIRQNTAMLKQIQEITIQNSLQLARLVERCHIKQD